MGIETAVLVGALAVSAVSTYKSVEAQRDAAKEQKKANKIQTARQKLEDMAAKRQKIREERVRRAQIQQQAENTGVGASSGEIGAIGVLANNLGQINANITQGSDFSVAAGQRLQKAADFNSRANTWNAIGGFASQVGGIAATQV